MATITYSWRQTVPSFQMNTVNTFGSQRDPAIGIYGDGYIAGWTNPPSASGLFISTGSSGQSQIANAIQPAFAQLKDGRSANSYTALGADPGGDIRVTLRKDGAQSDIPINTSTGDDSDSDIAALADGGYVVTWTRNFGGGDFDVRAMVINADGGIRASGPVDGGGLTISTTASAIASGSSSVAAYAGGFIVAWTEAPAGAGLNTSVHHRRYTAAGVPIDTSPMLLDGVGTQNQNVRVVGLRDGGYAFAYEDNSWDPGVATTDITFWIYNADGTSRGVTRANATTAGIDQDPTLTVLDNGFIVVGWRHNSSGEIRYQTFTPAGVAVGPEHIVVGSATTADIASLGNGLVVNVHASTISDGDGASIRSSTDRFARTTTSDATGETLVGDALPDIMLGNGGRDFLFGAGFAADGSFLPGSGNDTLNGGDDNDGLWGGDGNDLLNGGTGNDGIAGGAGDDDLNGGDGDDFLFGGDFSAVNGSRLPGSGNDALSGERGNDALYGFDGDDNINGGAGDDYVEGGEGADVISGGTDNDTLLGQAGRDIISGRSGFDYLYGGNGADTFIFRVGDSYDTVWDFSVAEEDVLRLDAGFGVTSLAQFQARAVTFVFEGKNYTQFTSADGLDQITLAGVRPDQLTAANFEVFAG